MISLIKLYQYLTRNVFGYVALPLAVKPECKFYPSCSDYAVESLNKHGFIKGTYKSFVRILKCNPWAKPGVDMP